MKAMTLRCVDVSAIRPARRHSGWQSVLREPCLRVAKSRLADEFAQRTVFCGHQTYKFQPTALHTDRDDRIDVGVNSHSITANIFD